MTREDRAREAAYALAAQHDIDLFRVIRRAGRKDRDKAKAVSLYLAETIIAEAAAMRERAAECADAYAKSAAEQRQLCTIDGGGESGDWYWAGREKGARDLAPILRALPATGEVGRG